MTDDNLPIDQMLATALRGEAVEWPSDWTGGDKVELMIERIGYHGIAGLLAGQAGILVDWPAPVFAWTREQGIALAMWELRHKQVLAELLAQMAGKKITALMLKGTAVGYDLYASPATRARGDTDVLVAPEGLDDARDALTQLGFRCQKQDEAIADDLALQEVWSRACGAGTRHDIDLHWQLLNSPALRGVLDFATCAADAHSLPRLSPDAIAMSRVLTLVHTCVHRAMHLTTPYFIDGVTYYGGDRLIWANDIHLLAQALSDAEWRQFTAVAKAQGVATVCLDGLTTSQRTLGTEISNWVENELSAVKWEPASAYLLESRQMGRAWKDFLATRDWRRKLSYLGSRVFPPPSFIRGKYPAMASRPLSLLYARRMLDLIRKRPKRSEK